MAGHCAELHQRLSETSSDSGGAHSYRRAHLQPRLDDVDRRVAKHAGSACHPSDEEGPNVANVLRLVPALEPLLEIRVDKEPDHLIGALFEDGGNKALVGAPDSWQWGKGEGGGRITTSSRISCIPMCTQWAGYINTPVYIPSGKMEPISQPLQRESNQHHQLC